MSEELLEGVHERLRERGASIACAESLTGGELSAALSRPAGASASFLGGVVAYATAVKESVLGVSEDLVAEHGVVSAECVGAMAEGARRLTGADWAVATTGVAGPEEQEGRPAGTVYLGLASAEAVAVTQLALEGDRAAVREAACLHAVEMLRDALA